MEKLLIFDPTAERKVEQFTFAPRPNSLTGLNIGLIDNTKFNSDNLLIKIAENLVRKYGCSGYTIRTKHNPSVPAHKEIVDALMGDCDVVIAGIGD